MHSLTVSLIVPFVIAGDMVLEAVVGKLNFADLVKSIDKVPDKLINFGCSTTVCCKRRTPASQNRLRRLGLSADFDEHDGTCLRVSPDAKLAMHNKCDELAQ